MAQMQLPKTDHADVIRKIMSKLKIPTNARIRMNTTDNVWQRLSINYRLPCTHIKY